MALDKLKTAANKVDVSKIKDKAVDAGTFIAQKAGDVKDAAAEKKQDISDKINELDNMLEKAITDYNDAYTQMNDKGLQLYIERTRAVDTVTMVENLVNSIKNTPTSFVKDFEEISIAKQTFTNTRDFAEYELQAAREATGGAGAGIAAGASVAFMGPTAAMWVATTFGTASTGTAISTLSGAAATNAALAWLGGGTVATGGGGMLAGEALLALAGPIGWSIAGATLLSSVVLLAKKKTKINKEKNEEIEAVKNNTRIIRQLDVKIASVLADTIKIRDGLNEIYANDLGMYSQDYNSFTDEQKKSLGSLVNTTKALSALFKTEIA